MNDFFLQSEKSAISLDWSDEALDCHRKAFGSPLSNRQKSIVLNRIARWHLYHCKFFASFQNYLEALKLDKNNGIAQSSIERLKQFPSVAGLDISSGSDIDSSTILARSVKLLISTGFVDRARYLLQSNIQRFNSHYEQNELAACIRDIDPKWAISIYDACHRSTPNDVSLIGKSACLMDINRYDEAQLILKPIFERCSDDPYVLYTFARLEDRLGSQEEASRLFARAKEIEVWRVGN